MTNRHFTRTKSHIPGSRGFTLVELLIVLAILSILAAVVSLGIDKAFGRSSEQAYATDKDTIQSMVAMFYYDGHACDTSPPSDAWDSTQDPVSGHYHPTATGYPSDKTLEEILDEANANGSDYTFPDSAIWMGLLYSSPAAVSTHDKDNACPLVGEMGPYVNEIPESASRNNYSTAKGSHTWIIVSDGTIHGLHWDGSASQAGCSGVYP